MRILTLILSLLLPGISKADDFFGNIYATNITAVGTFGTTNGYVNVGSWLSVTQGFTMAGSGAIEGHLTVDAVGWNTDVPFQFGGGFGSALETDGSIYIRSGSTVRGGITPTNVALEGPTALFFGNGRGLSNLSMTIGLNRTQYVTDFLFGQITNVYSNGLLVISGAFVAPALAMLGEDGGAILGEDGGKILSE